MKKKKKLKKKLCEYLKRGKAIARPLVVTIKRVNEIVRGWINYFRIGLMKQFVEELGLAKTQNKNDSHEAMEEAENHLQKPKLSKLEEPKRIQSGRYS